MLIARYPDIDEAEARRFVVQQFDFINADPNEVFTAERVVERYEATTARGEAGDHQMREKLAKLIYRGLSERPRTQSLQYFELMHAFQTATGISLSQHAQELVAIIDQLQEKGYIRWENMGGKMPLIFQGIDFDEWTRKVNAEKDSAVSVTYNLFGANNRVNNHSVDMSTNVVNENGDVQEYLTALRCAIEGAQLSSTERQSALEIVDEIDAQFSSKEPKKSVVMALLAVLPKVADITTIVGTIALFLK
ncbi:hypothetical protein DFP86_104173 [Paludibacterium purpuratum]|uniref:Uncharacterized protein n=2 Tax=Paludibacterium purpuratum TaxID=1144873 RepID=A0A4R7B826_9NEIS|nr:hypothetical protein DFP86_104173 [Paludibacterium purpuratum]